MKRFLFPTAISFLFFFLVSSCGKSGEGSVSFSTRKSDPNNKVIKVTTYNLENLMLNPSTISKKRKDFTGRHMIGWTKSQYQDKLRNIVKTMQELNSDIFGLQEVATAQEVNDLLTLIGGDYAAVWKLNPDTQLVDVVMVYKKNKNIQIKDTELIIPQNLGYPIKYGTILKVPTVIDSIAIDFVVCHIPHPEDTKPEEYSAFINELHDIVKHKPKNHNLVVMGDFNSMTKNREITGLTRQRVIENPFKMQASFSGSFYDGKNWKMQDLILYSGSKTMSASSKQINDLIALRDMKANSRPRASYYAGKRLSNKNGTSDHFPVSLELILKKSKQLQ